MSTGVDWDSFETGIKDALSGAVGKDNADSYLAGQLKTIFQTMVNELKISTTLTGTAGPYPISGTGEGTAE